MRITPVEVNGADCPSNSGRRLVQSGRSTPDPIPQPAILERTMNRTRLALLAATLALLNPPAIAQEPAPLLGQPRADFQARRREVARQVESGIVVVRGTTIGGREDFEEGRFRQSNPFAYLTGVEVPGASLIIRPSPDGETIYLPDRRADSDETFGIAKVAPASRFLADLFGAVADARAQGSRPVVYLLSPRPSERAQNPDARFVRWLREGLPDVDFRDLAPVLAEMRKAKSPAELDLLRRAIAITGDAQDAVMATIRPGLKEYQLEARVLGAFLDGGALRPGFASIIGSGPNATIPHYFESSRTIEDGDLVVVDIGAEYRYYTADITRTYPANGRFTPRQREVYQLVLDAQADAAAWMKPGVTRLNEMTHHTREYLRSSPLRARNRDGQDQTMDRFFIHGLSHYLGMDVHDVGDMARPIQVGEVFTIEPGIYIKGENIGVRIEDDYLMTEHGPEKLSGAIVSDPDEIEKRIAAARGSKDRP